MGYLLKRRYPISVSGPLSRRTLTMKKCKNRIFSCIVICQTLDGICDISYAITESFEDIKEMFSEGQAH